MGNGNDEMMQQMNLTNILLPQPCSEVVILLAACFFKKIKRLGIFLKNYYNFFSLLLPKGELSKKIITAQKSINEVKNQEPHPNNAIKAKYSRFIEFKYQTHFTLQGQIKNVLKSLKTRNTPNPKKYDFLQQLGSTETFHPKQLKFNQYKLKLQKIIVKELVKNSYADIQYNKTLVNASFSRLSNALKEYDHEYRYSKLYQPILYEIYHASLVKNNKTGRKNNKEKTLNVDLMGLLEEQKNNNLILVIKQFLQALKPKKLNNNHKLKLIQ